MARPRVHALRQARLPGGSRAADLEARDSLDLAFDDSERLARGGVASWLLPLARLRRTVGHAKPPPRLGLAQPTG